MLALLHLVGVGGVGRQVQCECCHSWLWQFPEVQSLEMEMLQEALETEPAGSSEMVQGLEALRYVAQRSHQHQWTQLRPRTSHQRRVGPECSNVF